MIHSRLDHIAVTACSLEAGVEYVFQSIGIRPQVGGEHPRMGTQNYVLKLGEKVYLEVISVNPNASIPDRPRWFELDRLSAYQPVRLATWVVRTDDIEAAVSASLIPLGNIETMSRGDLHWRITIPEDGSLPLGGVVPAVIQWQDVHPADTLQEFGCSLLRLKGVHPEAEKVSEVLQSIGFQGDFFVSPPASGEEPYLLAYIQTPTGQQELGTS